VMIAVAAFTITVGILAFWPKPGGTPEIPAPALMSFRTLPLPQDLRPHNSLGQVVKGLSAID